MNKIQISEARENTAYNIIDKIIEKGAYSTDWFITKEHIEKYIRPNLNQYYEFILFVLETGVPYTKEDKEIKKELEKLIIDNVKVVNDNLVVKEGDFN